MSERPLRYFQIVEFHQASPSEQAIINVLLNVTSRTLELVSDKIRFQNNKERNKAAIYISAYYNAMFKYYRRDGSSVFDVDDGMLYVEPLFEASIEKKYNLQSHEITLMENAFHDFELVCWGPFKWVGQSCYNIVQHKSTIEKLREDELSRIKLFLLDLLTYSHITGKDYRLDDFKSLIMVDCTVLCEFTNALTSIFRYLDEERKQFMVEFVKGIALPPNIYNTNKLGGCYVATAVYGSYDCPEVWTLRRFRDYGLATTFIGRLFIMLYYAVSPTLVKWFGNTKWFKKLWKSVLDKMVEKLQKKGFESTQYEDKSY